MKFEENFSPAECDSRLLVDLHLYIYIYKYAFVYVIFRVGHGYSLRNLLAVHHAELASFYTFHPLQVDCCLLCR